MKERVGKEEKVKREKERERERGGIKYTVTYCSCIISVFTKFK